MSDTHNLQAQSGRNNVQDNSTGKTEHSHNVVNSHNTIHVTHVHPAAPQAREPGEASALVVNNVVVLCVALLACLVAAILVVKWTLMPEQGRGHEPPIPPPAVLDVRMEDHYRSGQRFIGGVETKKPGWLYVVNVGRDGSAAVIFPNLVRQSAQVSAGERLELSALSVRHPKTGDPVPLTLSFPEQIPGDDVRERLLFFLFENEVARLRPGSSGSANQRQELLSVGLLQADDMSRVDGGDENSLLQKASHPGLIEQREFGYRLVRSRSAN